ncbi:hypothetical protein [Nonomuraea bangladeshensis]|uniref:hypothetical protein n=1 Tax=Nonomuraea bangladeshensis TaxID=404385 RepID=UPI003C2CABE9
MGTRIDDCTLWQVVWLRAVRQVGAAGPARRVVGWEALREEHPGTPPVEQPGWWSPVWTAAVAAALAHLLAVSGGKRVAVPDGPVAEAFRRRSTSCSRRDRRPARWAWPDLACPPRSRT